MTALPLNDLQMNEASLELGVCAGVLMSAVLPRWSPTQGPYLEGSTRGRSSSSRALCLLMPTGESRRSQTFTTTGLIGVIFYHCSLFICFLYKRPCCFYVHAIDLTNCRKYLPPPCLSLFMISIYLTAFNPKARSLP